LAFITLVGREGSTTENVVVIILLIKSLLCGTNFVYLCEENQLRLLISLFVEGFTWRKVDKNDDEDGWCLMGVWIHHKCSFVLSLQNCVAYYFALHSAHGVWVMFIRKLCKMHIKKKRKRAASCEKRAVRCKNVSQELLMD